MSLSLSMTGRPDHRPALWNCGTVRRIFADRLVYGIDVRTAAWVVSQMVADECLRSAGGCRPAPDLDAVADEVEDACRLIVGQHRNRSAALMVAVPES